MRKRAQVGAESVGWGDNVRLSNFAAVFAICAAAALATGIAVAGEPVGKVVPESVPANAPPSVTLTVATPEAGKDLTTASQVEVGGTVVPPVSKDRVSVTFDPPRRERASEHLVTVKNDKGDVLATARLRYVEPSPRDWTGLAIFYASIIFIFPFGLMVVDLGKAYSFAYKTRQKLIDGVAHDGLSIEELKLVLAELGRSPPGIPGLARNSIAFMLMMILGVAIVHILVISPPTEKIPDVVDRILVLLTGLLTSIVSFYFGSRAAESAQQAAATGGSSSAQRPADAIKVSPSSGRPGDVVTITGTGFGKDKGEVRFGEWVSDMVDAAVAWADTEIKVKVPATATPGTVVIAVTPKGASRPLSSSVHFTVTAGESGALTDENIVDGCDVPITDATPDADLPGAEGGVR
jgi:hypothetical protein